MVDNMDPDRPNIDLIKTGMRVQYKGVEARFLSNNEIQGLISSLSGPSDLNISVMAKWRLFRTIGELYLKRCTSYSIRKSIFLSTIGRCGTHWLKKLLEEILIFDVELAEYDYQPEGFSYSKYIEAIYSKEDSSPGNFIYTGHVPLNMLNPLVNKVNIIFMVRDLRDVIVSAVFFNNRSKNLSQEEISYKITEFIENRVHQPDVVSAYLEFHDKVPHLLVKYEDMINSPETVLRAILKHYGYYAEYLDGAIKKAVTNNSFKVLSDGRNPGQENTKHHFRKGVIGDWRNYFTKDHVELFNKKYDSIMRVCGYKDF